MCYYQPADGEGRWFFQNGPQRVFVQLERSKREQTLLYKASTALGAALERLNTSVTRPVALEVLNASKKTQLIVAEQENYDPEQDAMRSERERLV